MEQGTVCACAGWFVVIALAWRDYRRSKQAADGIERARAELEAETAAKKAKKAAQASRQAQRAEGEGFIGRLLM